MIDDFTDLMRLDDSTLPANIAKIGAVYSDGVSLIFSGEAAASTKHYKCNQYCKFSAGQTVFVQKVSGTYIVVCPIGNPSPVMADTAQKANSVKNNDDGQTILFSANVDNQNYFMWSTNYGWKRINNT